MPRQRPLYEIALERFLRDQCPLCGRGRGDSRGIEIRQKMGDIFCHNCGRAWIPASVLKLRHELPVNGASHPSELVAAAPSVLTKAPPSSFLRRLLRSIVALVGR